MPTEYCHCCCHPCECSSSHSEAHVELPTWVKVVIVGGAIVYALAGGSSDSKDSDNQ